MQTSPPLTAQQLAAFSSFAQSLADQVRPLSRQWFRHPLSVAVSYTHLTLPTSDLV